MNFTEKENYNFNDLVEIVKILRAPDGCPWDREQTHKSIRSNFIEETYEAVEAIDTEDNDLLKEAANRNMRDKTMDELYHFFCEKDGRVLKYKSILKKIKLLLKRIDSLVE